MVLHAIDGRVTGVRVWGRLEEVPKEMREEGGAPWWKAAVVKVEVEIDVDDPAVVTSPDGSILEKHHIQRDKEAFDHSIG
ncbi:hypothetical protein M407DRAFT_241023 [Tulasnella calospora MUT 4182]|uniref:Uncharacterized protein n=1 Tax=Tulasnella calospora MUT 4182 TaxID=1051891 RepID=A0A0C3QXB3_9AGAM|nr:hypothetical protein M407DRAFT_241023 [Tulasnella calospora MUT 4182]